MAELRRVFSERRIHLSGRVRARVRLRGLLCDEGSGDVVLVPADVFVVDRGFEAAFVLVEASRSFENEKVDWRPDDFASVGLKGKLGRYGASCSANMPLSTERDRCTAAFFASDNLSVAVFSPTSLPISYIPTKRQIVEIRKSWVFLYHRSKRSGLRKGQSANI